MGLKGINPLEQHADKIVLGIFGTAALGMVAWQFIGKEPTVKVGTQDVPLNRALFRAWQAGPGSRAWLKTTEPADPPTDAAKAQIVDQFRDFDKKLASSVSPARQLAGALDKTGGSIAPGLGGSTLEIAQYAEVAFPAPVKPTVDTFLATIDRSGGQQDAGSRPSFPALDPLDKASVTVESVFDGTALKSAVMDDPDGEGPIRALPKNWWDGSVQVLAAELYRQTLRPDGTWSEAEKVKRMPGRTGFLDKLDTMNTADTLNPAVKFTTDNADFIRRPPYYTVRFGDQWIPPTERLQGRRR